MPVLDRKREVLSDLVFVEDPAGLDTDRRFRQRGLRAATYFGGDPGELCFGGCQQGVAFATATLRQDRIETSHQPLLREIRGADFRQVGFVEEGALQVPFLNQFSDRLGS